MYNEMEPTMDSLPMLGSRFRIIIRESFGVFEGIPRVKG